MIALEADPAGACPLGIEPYDAWCVGLGGGLTQIDGTPLPTDAVRLPVAGILGRTVVGQDRSALGRIVNVLVDAHGQALAVVIDFGGFMGVGSRTLAVEWALLSFPPPGSADDIVLGLDDAAINATPAYDGSDEAVVIGPSPPEPVIAAKPAASPPPAAPPGPDRPPPSRSDRPPPSRSDRPPPMLQDRPPPMLQDRPPPMLQDRPPPMLQDRPPPMLQDRPPPMLPGPGDVGSTSKADTGQAGTNKAGAGP